MNGNSCFHPERPISHSKMVLSPLAQRLLYQFGMDLPHEKSEMYQRAVNFAERIYKFANNLPKAQWAVGDQFKRAAMSIAIIIAEGNGEWYPHERKDFYITTRGSAYDCLPLLELCRRRGLIDDGSFTTLRGDLEALAKMLTALIKGTDENREH